MASLRSADRETNERATEALVAAYWKPVYKYLRLKWHATTDDAEDLTQEFFARAIEKRYFDVYDPAKARFRTFVRTCVDGFISNELKARNRLKRGGGQSIVSLDFESAERELALDGLGHQPDPDEYFRDEWIRHLFGRAVERLRERARQEGRVVPFDVFDRYDLQAPDRDEKLTYAQLGAELNLSVTDVTNYLAAMRRDFRAIVLDELRQITGSDEEFQAEARLLGITPLTKS